ncbi:MAG: hypothetical protein M0T72_12705 [Candidatus Dormibacteraeota bacterium]|nr:hypothetical protein [Candidatus Dormibacteraeota bacterium]
MRVAGGYCGATGNAYQPAEAVRAGAAGAEVRRRGAAELALPEAIDAHSARRQPAVAWRVVTWARSSPSRAIPVQGADYRLVELLGA